MTCTQLCFVPRVTPKHIVTVLSGVFTENESVLLLQTKYVQEMSTYWKELHFNVISCVPTSAFHYDVQWCLEDFTRYSSGLSFKSGKQIGIQV